MFSSLDVMLSNTRRGWQVMWGTRVSLYPTHFLVVQRREKMHLDHSKNKGRTV